MKTMYNNTNNGNNYNYGRNKENIFFVDINQKLN
jgi:hypothetical protein